MKSIKNVSERRVLEVNTTEQQNPTSSKSIFFDEVYILKTDIEKYNVWIVLAPKPKLKKPYPCISQSSESDSYELTDSNALFIIIKHFLAQVKCVEKILFLKKEDTIHIWTAISEYNSEENRRLVYNQEKKLTIFLSKVDFRFDFYIIESEDVPEIESSGASIIWER